MGIGWITKEKTDRKRVTKESVEGIRKSEDDQAYKVHEERESEGWYYLGYERKERPKKVKKRANVRKNKETEEGANKGKLWKKRKTEMRIRKEWV